MQQSQVHNSLDSDIQLFTQLLGDVLRKHSRKRVLVMVERLREGFLELRRQEDPELRSKLIERIEGLDPQTLGEVIRAFNIYFALVNIAEEVNGHLTRREQVSVGEPLWVGSFDHTVRDFQEQGVAPEHFQSLLEHLLYLPVFTAHPTESKRRTILENHRRIFLLLQALHGHKMNREERDDKLREIATRIQVLWKTDEVRVQLPHRPR